ncbi:hypothetical protein J6590_100478 [Homalodisca vitripennis]|nr:hypothetical protein J6590_100478 [Homalodisca vitripennis]
MMGVMTEREEYEDWRLTMRVMTERKEYKDRRKMMGVMEEREEYEDRRQMRGVMAEREEYEDRREMMGVMAEREEYKDWRLISLKRSSLHERVLYDSTCKDYKDRDSRLAAAKRISEAMGINGFGPKEVITKFKNLRSSYCQELKKIADTERSGSGTDDIYVPTKVIWFENMNSFIRPFVQQRSTKSNLVSKIQ